jgi:hypothetical protein
MSAEEKEIFGSLEAHAAARFGSDRAEVLRPRLQSLAQSMAAVEACPLEDRDRPGFYFKDKD